MPRRPCPMASHLSHPDTFVATHGNSLSYFYSQHADLQFSYVKSAKPETRQAEEDLVSQLMKTYRRHSQKATSRAIDDIYDQIPPSQAKPLTSRSHTSAFIIIPPPDCSSPPHFASGVGEKTYDISIQKKTYENIWSTVIRAVLYVSHGARCYGVSMESLRIFLDMAIKVENQPLYDRDRKLSSTASVVRNALCHTVRHSRRIFSL
ncbi:hypothetical protein BC629DRAFT_497578 [Irpex lacteus]|nr:hypothetical protein BC629DRAFT_497578 [Irpex lacteus]